MIHTFLKPHAHFYIPQFIKMPEFRPSALEICNLCSLCSQRKSLGKNPLASLQRLLPYSRVVILTNSYINEQELNYLCKMLAEYAQLDIAAVSIIFAAHCAANASASQMQTCAGFLLAKLELCQATRVLVLGENTLNGLFGTLRAASIKKAKIGAKIVKFVINYELCEIMRDEALQDLFIKYLPHLRS